MELTFEVFTEADLPELTAVMTRAFDDDHQRHLGLPKGGPPGYDNGDFFRQWVFPHKQSHGFKVVSGGRIIGAVVLWIFEHGDNVLGTIFVDPSAQDSGVGTRVWQWVEAEYPETRSWRLETPGFAVRNHGFYERKCGFTKVEEKRYENHDWPMYVYRKDMGR